MQNKILDLVNLQCDFVFGMLEMKRLRYGVSRDFWNFRHLYWDLLCLEIKCICS